MVTTYSDLCVLLKRISLYIGLVVLGFGIIVLLGWCFNIEEIKRPVPKLVAMNPVTAIGFIMLGASFLLITIRHTSTYFRNSGYILAGLLAFIVVLHLILFVGDYTLQVDKLLFVRQMKYDAINSLSSRMAPNTALGFVLGSFALFFITSNERNIRIGQYLTILIGLLGLFSILGYTYEVKEFYGILVYVPMAAHTALSFFIFVIAMLLYTCDQGIMKQITKPGSVGKIGRVLIPLAVIIPIWLGYTSLNVYWDLPVTPEFGFAVLTLSVIIVFVGLIGYMIYSVNEKDKQRKRAEEQLKLTHILLQASIDSHDDVMFFSLNTQYQFLNYNNTFKVFFEEVYGIKLLKGASILDSIVDDELRKKVKKYSDETLAGKHTTQVEYIHQQWHNISSRPIIDEHDRIIGLTVLASNITERKRTEEEILTLNKELESFTYSVAHDLRAPLRIIGGYSDIIVRDYLQILDEKGQKLLNRISHNTTKMNDLIGGLLNLSKTGRLALDKRLVDMKALITAVIEEQVNPAHREKVEFQIKNLESLVCDSGLMGQVFANLITNAIKYSGKVDHPVVEIDSKRGLGQVTYCIKDNGVGFDMAYADKLFGVFQRLHGSKDFEGTGIGLALVQKIIHKHNGKIWAEGKLNKGATFYFSVPQ